MVITSRSSSVARIVPLTEPSLPVPNVTTSPERLLMIRNCTPSGNAFGSAAIVTTPSALGKEKVRSSGE